MAEYEEYHCLDPEKAKNNDQLAQKHPNDPVIVRLVALRTGLCDLVEKGIVDVEFAIDLFDTEKSKAILKRLEEDVVNNTEVDA